MRKIAGKLWKNCGKAAHLQEATLDIIMELKHAPKAADVVIEFVLRLGNIPTTLLLKG